MSVKPVIVGPGAVGMGDGTGGGAGVGVGVGVGVGTGVGNGSTCAPFSATSTFAVAALMAAMLAPAATPSVLVVENVVSRRRE